MVTRDPESKKRSLLDAALIEFAAKGLIGTRTEDIASRAGCSTGLVYTYFGSKEGLFDAVLDDITVRTVDLMPITPQDLPGYAVRLFEAGAAAPEIDRFVTWYELERGERTARDSVVDAMREKIAEVEAAQKAGLISRRLGPAELVLTVQTIARMWAVPPSDVVTATGVNGDARRGAIRIAVEALVQ